MEIKLTDGNFEEEVLKSKLPCLVDFWAEWCGPCRLVAPIIEKIAEEYEGKLKVCKLNVDDGPQTASRYGIMSIPTLAIFEDRKITNTIVGAVPKEKIEEKFRPFIK